MGIKLHRGFESRPLRFGHLASVKPRSNPVRWSGSAALSIASGSSGEPAVSRSGRGVVSHFEVTAGKVLLHSLCHWATELGRDTPGVHRMTSVTPSASEQARSPVPARLPA